MRQTRRASYNVVVRPLSISARSVHSRSRRDRQTSWAPFERNGDRLARDRVEARPAIEAHDETRVRVLDRAVRELSRRGEAAEPVARRPFAGPERALAGRHDDRRAGRGADRRVGRRRRDPLRSDRVRRRDGRRVARRRREQIGSDLARRRGVLSVRRGDKERAAREAREQGDSKQAPGADQWRLPRFRTAGAGGGSRRCEALANIDGRGVARSIEPCAAQVPAGRGSPDL